MYGKCLSQKQDYRETATDWISFPTIYAPVSCKFNSVTCWMTILYHLILQHDRNVVTTEYTGFKDKNLLFGFIPGYGVCDTIISMTSYSCLQVVTVEWFSTTLFLCHLNRLVTWMRRMKRKDHRKKGQLPWYKISLLVSVESLWYSWGENLKTSRQFMHSSGYKDCGRPRKSWIKSVKEQRGRSHTACYQEWMFPVWHFTEQALADDHHHFLLLLWPESLLLIDVPGPVSPQKTES